MTESTVPRVVTLGETMGLLIGPVPGSISHVGSLGIGIGGAESNLAIGLSRLGHPVAWVGRVGEDSFGDRIVRELRAEGVQLHVRRDPQAPTGLMLKEQRTRQQTNVWYYRAGSAGSGLEPADLPLDVIAAAEVLHVTGITPALSATAAAAVAQAVDAARSAGTLVSFDVNFRHRLWARARAADALTPLVRAADVVFAGVGEAQLFVPDTEDLPTLLAGLHALGPAEVVLKRGGQGSIGSCGDQVVEQKIVPVDVVDTVGAGDAFAAGYLAARLDGLDLRARMHRGALLGAWACTGRDDWQALPTARDLASGLGDRVAR